MTFKLFKWDPAWFEHADALKQIAPDWETELQNAIVSKRIFVALTMGCKVGIITNSRAVNKLTKAGHSMIMATYNKRLGIIDNNIPEGPSSYSLVPASYAYCYLKKATILANDLGWQLPKPMMRLISPQIKQNKVRSKKGQLSHSPSRKAFEYESILLDGLYELIERYFIDEEGKPITDPKKWPLKKNMESPILHGRLLDAADTLITNGQRRGNRKN